MHFRLQETIPTTYSQERIRKRTRSDLASLGRSRTRASPGTIVDVRILLSFVSGTCTYRLALPRVSLSTIVPLL